MKSLAICRARALRALRYSAVFTLVLASVSGCSSTLVSNEWAKSEGREGQWPDDMEHRDKSDAWRSKAGALPIELHGTLPGQSHMSTAAMISNVLEDAPSDSNDLDVGPFAMQRVVLYINEDRVPIRADFCAAKKAYRVAENKRHKLTLSAAMCDGPRIVTYAEKSMSDSDFKSTNINDQVIGLKKSLVGALYPAITLKEIMESGLE